MDSSRLLNFCHSLPKIELHAHLNGSLSDKTLPLLGCDKKDIDEYQKLKHIPVGQRYLKDCFPIFAIAHKATSSPKAVFIATKNVIAEFAEDNVIYLELRTTPRREEGMSAEDYVESVVNAIQSSQDGILVKLILSLNRQHSKEICLENLKLILKMQSKYPDIIKGIDLSGNPVYGSFNELKVFFEEARKNGLSTTIHCGETVNSEEIRDILEFKPDRIGHACYLHPNYNGCKENWALLKELKIPTEICLTSNIISGSRNFYQNHHVQEWIQEKLPFSLNTDDKGVFDTTSTQEFYYILKHFQVTHLELWKLCMNSIDHSFANEEEKLMLRKKLDNWRDENSKLFTCEHPNGDYLID